MPEHLHRPGVVSKVQGFLPKTLRARLMGAAAGILVLSLALAQPAVRPKREVTLTARNVPLSMSDPALERVGGLRFLGGLWLTSEDKGFGGLSGLSVEVKHEEVRLLGITDVGEKFTGRLVIQNDRPATVDEAVLEPLTNLQGAPIAGKSWGDAESVSRLPDGRVLVGFEQHHRVWAYGPDLTPPARAFETPEALQKAPSNGGLESIANWPDGRVLAITEQMKTAGGNLAAFLRQGGQWSALEWTPSAPGFEPSDATVLQGGDLLVLERYWSALAPLDPRSRVVRVQGDAVKPGAALKGELVAELRAPLVVDNFEGMAAWRDGSGATHLLLVSDDNFNQAQRTLLLSFVMADPTPARP